MSFICGCYKNGIVQIQPFVETLYSNRTQWTGSVYRNRMNVVKETTTWLSPSFVPELPHDNTSRLWVISIETAGSHKNRFSVGIVCFHAMQASIILEIEIRIVQFGKKRIWHITRISPIIGKADILQMDSIEEKSVNCTLYWLLCR